MTLSKQLLLFASLIWSIEGSSSTTSLKNVYDSDLEPCSHPGMAMTGEYDEIQAGNQTGLCNGNYSICVDLSTVEGDDVCKVMDAQDNFIKDIPQSDIDWWCEQEALPCHDDPSEQCPIQAWCISPDTFALYLSATGGCSSIPDIDCKSINQDSVWAILDESQNSTAHDAAITCLIDRCGMYRLSSLTVKSHRNRTELVGYGAAMLGATMAALLIMHRTSREPEIKEPLAPETQDIEEDDPQGEEKDEPKLSAFAKMFHRPKNPQTEG